MGPDERERFLPLAGKAHAGEPFFAPGRCLSATAVPLFYFLQVAPQKEEPESFCKLCTQLTAMRVCLCFGAELMGQYTSRAPDAGAGISARMLFCTQTLFLLLFPA